MRRAIILLVFLFSPLSLIWAQGIVKDKINARMLPTVWFSTLDVKEGERIKIYSAVQNNSGLDFKGEMIFYLDGVVLVRTPFSSRSEMLSEVSTVWLAVKGDHSFKTKISATLPENKEFLSDESAEARLSVSQEAVPVGAKESVINIADTVLDKVEKLAVSLADKLESTKILPEKSVVISDHGTAPRVSVMATSSNGNLVDNLVKTITNNNLTASAYNAGVDVLSFLLRKWIWTLSGLAILVLFWALKY